MKRSIPVLLFVLALLVPLWQLIIVLLQGEFFILPNDEITYLNAARLFAETGSLKASISVLGNTSTIGGFGWYGPMYGLLYGIPSRIFGLHYWVFPLVNYFFFGLTAFALVRYGTQAENRWLLACAVMSVPVMLRYLPSFFPESFHVFSGALLGLILVKMYTDSSPNRWMKYFILIVLVFSLFRPTTVFYVLALIPFAISKKQIAKHALLLFCCFGAVMVYMKLCFAPFTFLEAQPLTLLFQGNVGGFILATIHTLKGNLLVLRVDAELIYFLLMLSFTAIRAWREKNALLRASLFPPAVLLIVLLSFYVSESFYLNKQLALVMPCMIIAHLSIPLQKPMRLAMYALFLLPFIPGSLALSKEIRYRQKSHEQMRFLESRLQSFSGIKNHLTSSSDKPLNILVNLRNLGMRTFPFAFLPVSDAQNNQVLYLYNPMLSAEESATFPSDNAAHYDFAVSSRVMPDDVLRQQSLTLVFSDSTVFLYKKTLK